jgi:hypothetical protein
VRTDIIKDTCSFTSLSGDETNRQRSGIIPAYETVKIFAVGRSTTREKQQKQTDVKGK